MIRQLLLGVRFYLGFAPAFSRLGFKAKGLEQQPVRANFSGQTWLVTGASGGIGEAITVAAAALGARVLALGRNRSSLDRLAEAMSDRSHIETLAVDLSLKREVDDAVASLRSQAPAIDVLVNNVGVLLNEHSITDEGHETSFATNLLNHYRLTEGLMRAGHLAPGGVVINMSSGGMYSTPLQPRRLDVLDPERFDGVQVYARHKRAQVELTHHWNLEYGDQYGFHVMHPGWVDTAGVRTSLPSFRRLFRPILRNAAQGADTALWLAAERPPAADQGIWLDRSLQPEHLSDATRTGPETRSELVALLEAANAAG